MKITAEKNDLLEILSAASGFTSNKSTIASTEGVLFKTSSENECIVCAYDLEKGIKTTISCDVEEQGNIIINATRLIQIIRAMPNGRITLKSDERTFKTVIYNGKAKFELQALSGKDFPDLPELRGDRGFTIKHGDFKNIIQRTQFAIAVNNPRPELNGLDLDVKGNKITAVTCDGNRLAVFSHVCDIENVGVTTELNFNIIIPGKTISELIRFINDGEDTLKINVARKHIMFFIGKYTVFTRLIDAQYVDYDRFIPKAPKIFIETESSLFEGALERALLVTEERQVGQLKSPVICNLEDGILTVSSSSITGRVNDEIEVQQEGENIEIGFNCRFLHEAVRACGNEKIKISLTSPLMGMTIEPILEDENKKLLLLVLPVRLNK
ncbi:MAG: DNA polymerase III subunit beta [Clostridia bacterium]|nr:DNA polymerase III subunit beta [Clostridia bacterium]